MKYLIHEITYIYIYVDIRWHDENERRFVSMCVCGNVVNGLVCLFDIKY